MALQDPTNTPQDAPRETEPKPARVNKGQFAKGVSGNPGGRRGAKSLRELLKPHIPTIASTLAKIAKNPKHRDCVKAGVAVMDRYFGTPVQTIQADMTITHALAEIENRIIEHDPTWVPTAKMIASANNGQAVDVSQQLTPGENSPDDGGTIDRAESEAESAESEPPAGAG